MIDPNFRTAIAVIIKASLNGNPQHEAILTVGQTPALLVKHGLPDLELVITAGTIDKCVFDHGIKKGIIERLFDLTGNPKSIFKSAPPHANGSVVVTVEMHLGNPIIISIRANKLFGRNRYANEITSIYAKEGGKFEQQWTAAGLLIWNK